MRATILGTLIGSLMAVLVAGPLHAQRSETQPEPPRVLLESWEAHADEATRRIEEKSLDFEDIDELRAKLSAELVSINELSAKLDSELAPLISQRDALGPAPGEGQSESPDVARERTRLASAIEDLEGVKRRTQQASVRAAALIDRLQALRRQIFNEALLERGPSILDPRTFTTAISELGKGVGVLIAETRTRISEEEIGMGSGLVVRIVAPAAAMIFALLGFRRMRRILIRNLSKRVNPNMTASRRLALAAGLTAIRLVLPILALVVVFVATAASGLLGERGLELLVALGIAATLVIGAYALGSAFFSPRIPELRISALGDRDARRAHALLVVLATLFALDWILVVEGKNVGAAIEVLTLYNTTLQILGGVALWSLVSVIQHRLGAGEPEAAEGARDFDDGSTEQDTSDEILVPFLLRVASVVYRIVAVLAPVLALSGYFAASRFVFHPTLASAGLIGFFVLLYSVVREVIEGIAAPAGATTTAQRRLRLIPVMAGFLLSLIALPLLALIWGATTVDLLAVWRGLGEGFAVGDLTVSPAQFLYFCVVFAVGYLLTRLIQAVLRHSVLPLTSLDTGARAAIIAGTGYIGILAAALVAVSTAGLNLSNLAIVAGALSVGIGFGLQNIVNNFVSGLILLIERPVKAGDWVEIPSGMGYVKQINVRSTEIETFDRSALIVPNSELISSTVTNYTHHNLQGRMILKISVAYGTDTRKIESLLLEIARGHPMVLRRPAPWIYFAGFVNGALEFEIRAILRDVNWVLNVRSDLNHEIARRFAEEGIEIPYPQRDLHLRNAGDVAAALGLQPAQAVAAAGTPAKSSPPPRRRSGTAQHDDVDADAGDASGDADGDGR
ncbi:mechanosensitive ion channel family protein [Limibaculum sp. M0105]|uniref:Mechanosensitive ion channel family protein n=1 Tax=Thermohalobaculum xanthum TaxID=2753746 RepID=A0A8J7M602_9RHOB|nr:DUF3772 domain-containing protein [Thermohalobaculum xanthum]MBK0398856.1 mechanosensitive ion channel family protein [Thermohalobaculum xanthum]